MLIRTAVMELVMYPQSDFDSMLVLYDVRTFKTKELLKNLPMLIAKSTA